MTIHLYLGLFQINLIQLTQQKTETYKILFYQLLIVYNLRFYQILYISNVVL